MQIGVAAGRLRSGTYGHPERRTFCCLGDAVNLAARLMTRAPAGGIWVHGDVADAAGDRFDWDDLPPITVKGRQQAVPGPLASSAARGPASGAAPRAPLATRWSAATAELARLRGLWAAAAGGEGQVVVVQAEAGTGKSRLVGELVDELVADGVAVSPGRGDAAGDPGVRTPPGATCGATCSASTPESAPSRRERRGRSGSTRGWSRGPRCSARCSGWPCPTAT